MKKVKEAEGIGTEKERLIQAKGGKKGKCEREKIVFLQHYWEMENNKKYRFSLYLVNLYFRKETLE